MRPNMSSRVKFLMFFLLNIFFKGQYLSCKKGEKRALATCIVNAIRAQSPPGRYLEVEPRLGSWVEVDESRAVEKTCQTFRKKNNNNNFQLAPNSSTVIINNSLRSNLLHPISNVGITDSPKNLRCLSIGFAAAACNQQVRIGQNVPEEKEKKERFGGSSRDSGNFH